MAKSPWDEVESGVTAGELIRLLKSFPSDTPICFGSHGHNTFYRVKDRGGVAQIEFNEAAGVHYELLPDHPYKKHFESIDLK